VGENPISFLERGGGNIPMVYHLKGDGAVREGTTLRQNRSLFPNMHEGKNQTELEAWLFRRRKKARRKKKREKLF